MMFMFAYVGASGAAIDSALKTYGPALNTRCTINSCDHPQCVSPWLVSLVRSFFEWHANSRCSLPVSRRSSRKNGNGGCTRCRLANSEHTLLICGEGCEMNEQMGISLTTITTWRLKSLTLHVLSDTLRHIPCCIVD